MATRQQIRLSIAEEFSTTPGPRTRAEGKHSAEEFFDTILERRFDEAVSSDAVLLIDLDGGYGFGTSFLEEAFGGLARKKGIQDQTAQVASFCQAIHVSAHETRYGQTRKFTVAERQAAAGSSCIKPLRIHDPEI